MPRTVEVSAGLIHATGYPNPGIEAFLNEVLPTLASLPSPLIVNIAGKTLEDWKYITARLQEAGAISAIELNLTPLDPQAAPSETESLSLIQAVVQAVRKSTSLPLIAKLPTVGAEVGYAARAAVEAGADIVAVGQALPAVAVRLSSHNFRLPNIVGGLSGPAIKPLALYQTWRVAQTVTVPIVGGGGIMTLEDAEEFFVAGAKAVSIGIASMIQPSIWGRITHGTDPKEKQ
jgi:dihydroorotate dehydrogenase (NAD+) catalytic subunit